MVLLYLLAQNFGAEEVVVSFQAVVKTSGEDDATFIPVNLMEDHICSNYDPDFQVTEKDLVHFSVDAYYSELIVYPFLAVD